MARLTFGKFKSFEVTYAITSILDDYKAGLKHSDLSQKLAINLNIPLEEIKKSTLDNQLASLKKTKLIFQHKNLYYSKKYQDQFISTFNGLKDFQLLGGDLFAPTFKDINSFSFFINKELGHYHSNQFIIFFKMNGKYVTFCIDKKTAPLRIIIARKENRSQESILQAITNQDLRTVILLVAHDVIHRPTQNKPGHFMIHYMPPSGKSSDYSINTMLYHENDSIEIFPLNHKNKDTILKQYKNVFSDTTVHVNSLEQPKQFFKQVSLKLNSPDDTEKIKLPSIIKILGDASFLIG